MVMESRTVNEILQTLDEYIADLRLYQQLSNYEFGFCHPFDRLRAASERQRRISSR